MHIEIPYQPRELQLKLHDEMQEKVEEVEEGSGGRDLLSISHLKTK